MNRIKKALTGIVTMMLALTMMVMPVSAAGFSDTAEHWAKENIDRWAEASVLNGKPSGNFEPEAYITRAEVAKVMSVMLGLSEKPVGKYNTVFKDVPTDAWYYHYVMACADAGIINGKGEGMYAPEANITREEAFKLIMCGLLGEENIVEKQADGTVKPKSEYAKNSKAILSKFSDYNKIEWSEPYLAEIVGRGAVNGDDKNEDGKLDLRPQDNITRAEVTKILDCLVAIYITADGTVSEPSKAAKGWDEKTQEFVQADNQVGTFVVVHDAQEGNWVIQNETDGNITITNTDSEKDIKVTVKVSNTNKSDDVVVKQGTTCVEVTEEKEVIIVPEAKPVDPEKPSTPSETPCSHVYVKDDSKCTDCTKDREVKATCSNCGASFVYETIKAHGHTYENGKCTCCGKAEPVTHTCVFERTNCAIAETVACECEATHDFDAVAHKFEAGICTECGMEEFYNKENADNSAMKFHANVTSDKGFVDVNVTNDYAAKLEVAPGAVNANSVTATVEMLNVGSLGVDGVRSETKTFTTGLGDRTPELGTWLDHAFGYKNGYVNVKVEGVEDELKYTLTGTPRTKDANDKYTENAVITASPSSVELARDVWAELTDHVKTEEQTAPDSYAVIANGSYLVIGDDKLSFEKDNEGHLVLDNFSEENGLSALQETIRKALQLNTHPSYAEKYSDIEIYLTAGTKLAVSSSAATLKDNCTIKIDALAAANSERLKTILPELQGAESSYAMAEKLVRLIDELIFVANEQTITVDISFEKPVEKDTKFYFGMTANNADDNGTTKVDMEVFDDYSLEINLPLKKISSSYVGLDVRMKDVASLGVQGEKKHHLDINTNMTVNGDLAIEMSNAKDFEWAKINATIDGVKCTYTLESDMDQDWVTITGTTETEAARAAWEKLTDHVTPGDNTSGDSYVLIDGASFIDTTHERLQFEEGVKELELNNFNDLSGLKQNIKDSVTLVNAKEEEITLFVGAGTVLAISDSCAILDDNAIITITGMDLPEDVLATIQAASDGNNEALVKALLGLLNDFVYSANKQEINVDIKFTDAVPEEPVVSVALTLEEESLDSVVEEEPTIPEETQDVPATEEPTVPEETQDVPATEEPTTVDTVSGSNLDA